MQSYRQTIICDFQTSYRHTGTKWADGYVDKEQNEIRLTSDTLLRCIQAYLQMTQLRRVISQFPQEMYLCQFNPCASETISS